MSNQAGKHLHIFLTGDRQVGKSTIIRDFLTNSGRTADGFVTYWEPGGDGGRNLYLAPFPSNAQSDQRHLLAPDKGRGLIFSESTIRAFEVYGTEIAGNSGKCDFIVMDELGFLETKAVCFKQVIMRHINGDVPILGVMKASKTGFLDSIRAHPKVEVREVTVENRTEVLQWLLERNPYL